ncbi:MAG: GNAT family N-acetyltransferase [Thermoplasmata archaeon]
MRNDDTAFEVRVKDSPQVSGLSFRRYRGLSDVPAMVAAMNESLMADLVDLVIDEGEFRLDIERPVNMNPLTDILIVEGDGRIVGHTTATWRRKLDGVRVYSHYAHLLPEWRERGVREAMVRWAERRIVAKARRHPRNLTKRIETYANSADNDWKRVLVGEGYTESWHIFEMVRDKLDDVPDMPLPEGIEVRPVRPEHYRKIWEASKEALMDERSYLEERHNEDAYRKFFSSPMFMPELWQIAWDGDEVVGGVHNYINKEENRALGRNWGHTERIFVRRAWRNRGVAKALIARSLRVLRQAGADKATLDVDSENPSGALRLYEAMGYRSEMHFTLYKKELSA